MTVCFLLIPSNVYEIKMLEVIVGFTSNAIKIPIYGYQFSVIWENCTKEMPFLRIQIDMK